MISSSSSQALMRVLAGQEDERIVPLPKAMGPTLVKIADPTADAEMVVELLDEATREGKRRNRYLQRRKQEGLLLDEDNAITYGGRACCGALVVEINARLHVLAIPSEYTCTCGAVYRVQNTPREERRHAW